MVEKLIRRVDLSTEVLEDGAPLAPVLPGEVLREEFMVPLGISARALAAELEVPANRITAIINGTRAITAGTALLLAEKFGTSAEFWMNLQSAHDLEVARSDERYGRWVAQHRAA